MSQGLYLIFTDPADDTVEAEYNDWYDKTHIPQVTQVPGVVRARRYRVVAGSTAITEHRYVAAYDLEGEDVNAIVAEIGARAARGDITSSKTVRMDPRPRTILYEAI